MSLPLLAILLLPALAPPEVHGIAMASAALLVLLAYAIALFDRSAPPRGSAWIVGAALGGTVLSRAADAPGAAWGPLSAGLLAAAVAASAGGRGEGSKLRTRVAGLLAASGVVVGVRSVWERFFGLERLADSVRALEGIAFRDEILGRLAQGRAYGGLVTPAAAGIFLVVCAAATAGLALSTRGRLRTLASLAVLVQLSGLVATRSLSAAGALALAAGVAALASTSRRAIAIGAAIAAAALAILAAGIAWRGEAALSLDHPDSPWRLRAGNVRIAAAIVREAPWVGAGPGGYAEAFSRHRRAGDNESRHAHCLPAELLAEFGIPVGSALAALFFVHFLGGVRRAFRSADPLRAGLAFGGCAFALHNLADFTAWMPSILWSALIATGAAREVPSEEHSAPSPRGLASLALLLVGVAAGVAAGAGVSQDARRSGLDAAVAGDRGESARLFDRAVRWAPWDPDAAVARASGLLDDVLRSPAGETDRTRLGEACDRAVGLSPVRASARALRARARMLDGDVPGAFADLGEAVRLHPLREDYRADLETLRTRMPGGLP